MSWKIKEKQGATLSRESGVILKEWGGKRSVALVYPNRYEVGMANLAVHSIYGMLNGREDIVCERAFLPGPADLREHMRTGTPILSLESQRPLSDFDAIAFTVSFENDYLGIIPILSASKIEHRASERRDTDPLILAGGAAPTLNPLPLARIADAVILGEMEEYEDDLIEILSQMESKAQAALELAKIGATRRHAKDLDSFRTETVIHYRKGQFHDMHLVEVERGCPHRCRFCATPAIYGELRMRSADSVLAMAEGGLAFRKKIGLVGADLLSHPEFERIAEGIHAMGATFSPSSVRADGIDEVKAKLLSKSGHRSIALGVEAARPKLRATLAKGISDAKILNAAATLAREGITNIRLYFMIGLPEETDEDIEAIPEFAKGIYNEIASHAPKRRRSTAVDMTVTPFVPKPGTPFEGKPFASEDAIKHKLKALKRLVGRHKGLTLRHDSYHDAASEHLLANGDESSIDFLEKAYESGSVRKVLKS